MEGETIRTHVGPFKIEGETAWFVPSGAIFVLASLCIYAWLIINVLSSRPLVCGLASNYASILGATMGLGAGLLVAAVFEHPVVQLLSFLGSAVTAGIGGAALVVWIFSSQCISFQMFVRQLVGL
jgi:hypothetical protein